MAQQQLRDELREQHQAAVAHIAAEHAAGLEAGLDARSTAVQQDNRRLRAELKLHAQAWQFEQRHKTVHHLVFAHLPLANAGFRILSQPKQPESSTWT